MSPRSSKPLRSVHVSKGQTLEVHAGAVVVLVERFASGAVNVRNGNSGKLLRCWAPKEAREGG